VGKGELGDYSCDLHRECTPFPHLCAAVPKLQSNLPTGGSESVRQKEIILAQLGDPDAALALQLRCSTGPFYGRHSIDFRCCESHR